MRQARSVSSPSSSPVLLTARLTAPSEPAARWQSAYATRRDGFEASGPRRLSAPTDAAQCAWLPGGRRNASKATSLAGDDNEGRGTFSRTCTRSRAAHAVRRLRQRGHL
eukprot:161770-Chlamydomonas_euryale.AAC.4